MNKSNEGVFRKEAIKAKRGDSLGRVQQQAPRLGCASLIAGATAVAVMPPLIFGHYTRHASAKGAHVHAGQPLVEVSGEEGSAALDDTHAAVVSQLRLKRSQLQAELDEARELSMSQRQEMRAHATYSGVRSNCAATAARRQQSRALRAMGQTQLSRCEQRADQYFNPGLETTRIVIAHWPETITSAKRRVHLVAGRVCDPVEPGARLARSGAHSIVQSLLS